MKNKAKAPTRTIPVLCTVCGHNEFERSLSETACIVQLAFSKDGTNVKEKIIREGNIKFTYRCMKCRTTLVGMPGNILTV